MKIIDRYGRDDIDLEECLRGILDPNPCYDQMGQIELLSSQVDILVKVIEVLLKNSDSEILQDVLDIEGRYTIK